VPFTRENLQLTFKEESEDMARQEVSTAGSTIWQFAAEGDKHEGVYSGIQVLDPQYKPLFKVGDKLVKPTAQIERAFATIPVGSYVWIEFKGKVSIKGGKTMNTFKIENDPDLKAPEKEAF